MRQGRKLLHARAALIFLLVPLLMSLCALPASADVCCPQGCVASGYGGGCWYRGTTNSCPAIACPPGSSGGATGGGGRQGGGVAYDNYPRCVWLTSLGPGVLASLTQQCLSALSGNAQFLGCLFEDDAGRAEDQRTGLSCPAREAALASQCQARCKSWAASRNTCTDSNSDWQKAFGDIGGGSFGSARVDLCGPRLKTAISGRIRRQLH